MRRWIPMMLVMVGVAGLSACGSDGEEASSAPSAPDSAQASSPVPTLPEPTGVEVVEVLEGVEYYGACGNEILTTVDGDTFFPLSSDEVEALDTDRYATDAASGDTEPSGLVAAPRVVPPGPGDDVGTLVVYADGIARFESDSGLVRWLTDEYRDYNFVC